MKKNRFTEVCILDVCTSDYFTGYSFPVIAVPVENGMTGKELAKSIQSEINSTYEYLCNESENSFTESEIKIFDRYCKKLAKDKTNLFPDLEPIPEDCEDYESCYMYLSLCKPVTKYGIKFLN